MKEVLEAFKDKIELYELALVLTNKSSNAIPSSVHVLKEQNIMLLLINDRYIHLDYKAFLRLYTEALEEE